MRLSPLRHTLAVLRTTIGLTQKELAALLACSVPTIQAIELGKLKLSERLGRDINVKTDVSFTWLMSDDATAPIVDDRGQPYSKSNYERARSKDLSAPGVQPRRHMFPILWPALFLAEIGRANLAAMKTGDAQLLYWRLWTAITKITGEFPGADNAMQEWLPLLVLPPEVRSQTKFMRQFIGAGLKILPDYYRRIGRQMDIENLDIDLKPQRPNRSPRKKR